MCRLPGPLSSGRPLALGASDVLTKLSKPQRAVLLFNLPCAFKAASGNRCLQQRAGINKQQASTDGGIFPLQGMAQLLTVLREAGALLAELGAPARCDAAAAAQASISAALAAATGSRHATAFSNTVPAIECRLVAPQADVRCLPTYNGPASRESSTVTSRKCVPIEAQPDSCGCQLVAGQTWPPSWFGPCGCWRRRCSCCGRTPPMPTCACCLCR